MVAARRSTSAAAAGASSLAGVLPLAAFMVPALLWLLDKRLSGVMR